MYLENTNSEIKGHLSAIFTILIWGTTFISTKFLLVKFSPIEILFFRFILGLIALFIAKPKIMKLKSIDDFKYFFIAGITGVTLYFLFENIALTYTDASNIGIIVSVSPFFTAILSQFFLPKEKLKIQFFIGFVFAITGITILSLGSRSLSINPIGDILGIFAAITWAIYSIAMKKIGSLKYNTIQTTRFTFLIGIIFMIPFLFFMDFEFKIIRFKDIFYLGNILYLGIGASALCFATWNWSVKILGAIRTSVYVYLIPVITLFFSVLVLNEELNSSKVLGTIFILIGLIISENKIILKLKQKNIEKRRRS
ncbi:MAG: DMT family transporter [Andreesenia angusta]|nr:DMT family transporter [Andreesenia angusta]